MLLHPYSGFAHSPVPACLSHLCKHMHSRVPSSVPLHVWTPLPCFGLLMIACSLTSLGCQFSTSFVYYWLEPDLLPVLLWFVCLIRLQAFNSWVDSILSYNLTAKTSDIYETPWRDGAWHKYGRAKFQSGSRSEGWSKNFGCTFFNIFNTFFNLSVVFSENNSWILLEKNRHIYGDTFLRVCTIWCRSKYIQYIDLVTWNVVS